MFNGDMKIYPYFIDCIGGGKSPEDGVRRTIANNITRGYTRTVQEVYEQHEQEHTTQSPTLLTISIEDWERRFSGGLCRLSSRS